MAESGRRGDQGPFLYLANKYQFQDRIRFYHLYPAGRASDDGGQGSISYLVIPSTEAFFRSHQVIIYWGDFLHMRQYHQGVARRLVQSGLSKDLETAILQSVNFEQKTAAKELIPAEAFVLALKRFMLRFLTSENQKEAEPLYIYLQDSSLNFWPSTIPENRIDELFPTDLMVANTFAAYEFTMKKIDVRIDYIYILIIIVLNYLNMVYFLGNN